jgi:hypothetical protein
MKELRFEIPEGYVIDFYRSDFPNGYIQFYKLLDTKMNEADVSIRLYNAIRCYFQENFYQHCAELSISELSKISIKTFSRIRNAGKLTMQELKEFCLKHEIGLRP